MPIWTLIVWLVIGGVAGFLAQKIMGGKSPYGVLGDVILGIAGALVGGYGLSLMGISGSGGLIATFIVAVVGALLILWIARKIKG